MIIVFSSINIHVLSFEKKLLIGQLSETLRDGNETVFNYAIFDSVPIKSHEVIVEQIECLEKVLSPGLVVLGVASSEAYNSSVISNFLSILSESPYYTEFIYIQLDHDQPYVKLCSNPDVEATLSDQGAFFSTLRCMIHPALPQFPFLLMKSGDGGERILLDPQSTKCISAQVSSDENYSLIQLGGNPFHSEETMLVLSFFSCLPYLSGKSLYNCIARWMKNITKTTDIIPVYSQRNPNLVYACQLEQHVVCRDTFTRAEWRRLRELLEDAADETIECSQLLGRTISPTPTCELGKIGHREKESDTFIPLLAIGLAVMAIAIAILMHTW